MAGKFFWTEKEFERFEKFFWEKKNFWEIGKSLFLGHKFAKMQFFSKKMQKISQKLWFFIKKWSKNAKNNVF